jgi:MerR family transcriptional regulator/heat shock protein HspR
LERKQRTQQQTEAYQASPPRIRIRPDQASLAKTDQGETAPDRTEGHPQVTAGHPRGSEGVYVISVAARLLEMHPQTLRKYERLGLVQPARTIGMLRLYSEQDLYQLRLIRHMEESLGLNLAGVEWALSLVSQLLEMHRRLAELVEAELLHRVLQQEMERLFTAMNLPLSDPPSDLGQTPEAQTNE